MTRRFRAAMSAVSAITALLSLASVRAAQTPAPTAQTRSVSRTADGKPDFSGIWQVMNSAAWDIQAHHAQKGVPGGLGVVVGNEIPYLPAAAAKRKENSEKRATADP